jgi:hypothetical protein
MVALVIQAEKVNEEFVYGMKNISHDLKLCRPFWQIDYRNMNRSGNQSPSG